MIDDELQLFIKDAVAEEAGKFQKPDQPERKAFPPEPSITKKEVQDMIEARVDKLKINGPSVTGSPRNGWAISAPAGNAAGGTSANFTVCMDNGDGSFTQKTARFQNGMLIIVE